MKIRKSVEYTLSEKEIERAIFDYLMKQVEVDPIGELSIYSMKDRDGNIERMVVTIREATSERD